MICKLNHWCWVLLATSIPTPFLFFLSVSTPNIYLMGKNHMQSEVCISPKVVEVVALGLIAQANQMVQPQPP
jgi:hypothetical protein